MSNLTKFLGKFANEFREVGGAIGTIALGVALDPKERAKVQGVVDLVQQAADNIEGSLKSVEKLDASGVTKTQLKNALKEVVADLLPDMLAGMIEAQLREQLKLAQASAEKSN